MLNHEHVDIPRLKIDPNERGYLEHKKCFKICINTFDAGTLSNPEKKCAKDCLLKFRESERYLIEKMKKMMEQHAAQDMSLKALYAKQEPKTEINLS